MAREERIVSQNSTGYFRTIEKAFEDSEYNGVLDLSGHKLTVLPDYAGGFELNDLISVGTSVYINSIPVKVLQFQLVVEF